jgi:hypothetical protein
MILLHDFYTAKELFTMNDFRISSITTKDLTGPALWFWVDQRTDPRTFRYLAAKKQFLGFDQPGYQRAIEVEKTQRPQ